MPLATPLTQGKDQGIERGIVGEAKRKRNNGGLGRIVCTLKAFCGKKVYSRGLSCPPPPVPGRKVQL